MKSMQENHWQQIETIFNEAALLPMAERETLVRRHCAGDEELYREVWRLVEDDTEEDEFLQEPIFTLGAQIIENDFLEMPEKVEFASYKLQKLLGRGGMGAVFLAQDTRLNRLVALKILPAAFAQDAERMRRFVQEAKAASALNHPNILTIYETGETDNTKYIASEYVEGKTLSERLRGEPLNLKAALDVAAQIASALQAAHGAKIIHRDIKPDNVMIRPDGFVKLLDFGIAKLTEKKTELIDAEATTANKASTTSGMIIGTAAYVSPEQARGKAVDARTDIFSFGLVLYEMLSGKRAFEGENAMDVISSILQKEPVPLSRLVPDVPREIERIANKALRKDCEERYQTAKDLLIDLKSLRRELDFQAALELSSSPDFQKARTDPNQNEPTAMLNYHSNEQAAQATDPSQTISSAEHKSIEFKRHKLSIGIISAALILSVAAAFYFSNVYRKDKISSIAVLPFVNVGGDASTEYLSDGISESLINSLSRLSGVKVIARNSAFKFKGKDTDLQETAKALGVETILTGRIARQADDYLINVALVDARDGTQMWGEQYNRKATDLQRVQSEISREIAEKLRVRLNGAQEQRLAKRETVNPQAYELLLKGRFYWNKGGTENRKKSIEYTNQAIAADPNYATAYADLSISYTLLISNGVLDPKEFTPKALEAARRALELDNNLAEAHLALAWIKLNEWDWAKSDQEYKRAIELNPNLARAYDGYAYCLSFVGRHNEAVEESRRAKLLDPISLVTTADAGNVRYLARQYDEAIAELNNALELDPNFATTYVYFGYVYTAKGMYPEAIASYQKAIGLSGDTTSRLIFLGAAYAKAGETDKAREILNQLETGKEYVSPCELAILYSALGEREQAFASLEKAYAAHDLQMQYIGVDPAFDALRDDARFQDFIKRVGIFL